MKLLINKASLLLLVLAAFISNADMAFGEDYKKIIEFKHPTKPNISDTILYENFDYKDLITENLQEWCLQQSVPPTPHSDGLECVAKNESEMSERERYFRNSRTIECEMGKCWFPVDLYADCNCSTILSTGSDLFDFTY